MGDYRSKYVGNEGRSFKILSTIVSRGMYGWRSYASLYPVLLADGAVLHSVEVLGSTTCSYKTAISIIICRILKDEKVKMYLI